MCLRRILSSDEVWYANVFAAGVRKSIRLQKWSQTRVCTSRPLSWCLSICGENTFQTVVPMCVLCTIWTPATREAALLQQSRGSWFYTNVDCPFCCALTSNRSRLRCPNSVNRRCLYAGKDFVVNARRQANAISRASITHTNTFMLILERSQVS